MPLSHMLIVVRCVCGVEFLTVFFVEYGRTVRIKKKAPTPCGEKVPIGTPNGIRTRAIRFERAVSWAARRWVCSCVQRIVAPQRCVCIVAHRRRACQEN